VSSNSLSGDGTTYINYCITIQDNSTYTGDQYEYKKMIPIQEISMNTGKQYSFEIQYK